MAIPRDVEVKFEELNADHGGRTHPLMTGSRPQFYYLGQDWDCNVEIISAGSPDPRVGVRAYLAFLSPHEHFGRLQEGSPFLFREGHRTIGFGIVTRLVDLEHSARIAAADGARYTWHREPAT